MAHIAEFGLSFGTEEEYAFRLEQFVKKDEFIQQTNSEQNLFWVAHNKFSTWSELEYERLLNRMPSEIDESKVVELPEDDIPASIDWRDNGSINPV